MFSYTPAASSLTGERKGEDAKNNNKDVNKSKVTLEELFNYGRIKKDAPLWHKILFSLYLPFGFLLMGIRLICFFFLCLSILILPTWLGNSINMPLMKIVCGLVVKHNNKERGQKPLVGEPHIVACNHVADFDTFAMWAVLPRFHTLTGAHLKVIPLVGSVYRKLNAIFVTPTPEGRAEVKAKVTELLETDPDPVVIFPEGGLTNGRKGTMMYHKFVFSTDAAIVPLAIRLCDPWPVYHDYLGSTWTRNFLWFLFVPFHVFEMTILPTEKRKAGETPEDFAARVQKLTSDYLNIEATHHSYSQKKALWQEISSGKKKVL